MKRVSPRWYEWSRYSPALRLDEHGHFLAGTGGESGVVIDPVPFQEGDEAQIRELGGAQGDRDSGRAGGARSVAAVAAGLQGRPAGHRHRASGQLINAKVANATVRPEFRCLLVRGCGSFEVEIQAVRHAQGLVCSRGLFIQF